MREIKFRAWDPINRVMECNVNVNQGTPVKQGYQWFNKENTVLHSELMQYTGLNDKNGKDIYEGDILTDRGEEPPLYVEYSIKHGAFCFVDKFDRHGTYYYTAQTISYEQFEVIGNIYENPELLES